MPSVERRVAVSPTDPQAQHALGAEIVAFERAAASRCGCGHAIGLSAGSDALLVSLMALGVGPGDEVVTTAYSFFATARSIVRLGARPAYVDIDPDTSNIDAERVAGAITPRTRAILPAHLFGQMAEMAPILELSRQSGIPVVEDAGQAMGAEWLGRQAGSLGSAGCFRFFPSKDLGGFDGGSVVTTNDAGLAERVRLLRDHGTRPEQSGKLVAGSFRLGTLQATALLVKLGDIDACAARRRASAAAYRQLFAGAGLAGAVRLPTELPHRRHVYSHFVIRCEQRDALAAHLKARLSGHEAAEPVPVYLQDCLETMLDEPADLPEAERASRDSLALPIHPGLTEETQAAVVGAIAEFLS